MYNVVNVTDEEQNIHIDGYKNTWSAFEKLETIDATYYIYENDRWGDCTCFVVVGYADMMPIAVYETYDNLIQCLIDEKIIE